MCLTGTKADPECRAGEVKTIGTMAAATNIFRLELKFLIRRTMGAHAVTIARRRSPRQSLPLLVCTSFIVAYE
jgi:hypothetical protein